MRALRTSLALTALLGMSSSMGVAQEAADILARFRPSFKGVEYDTPATPDEIAACKVEKVLNKSGEPIGFAVRDGQGKLLRKFVDTNGIKDAKGLPHLDQWSYYHDGFEVYREVDTNEDNSLDEVRWLNSGGTRIGEVQGGRIVSWKRISAEEASKVLVQALIAGDLNLLESVLATPEEIKALGLPEELAQRAAESAKNRRQKVQELQKRLKGWDGQSTWSRFDGMMPHVIPADAAPGLGKDLILYENAVVFVSPSASSKVDPRDLVYLHIPEVVQLGETWKFLDLPLPVDPAQPVVNLAEADSLRSMIYRGDATAAAPGLPSPSPESEALLKQLAEHDAKMPGADGSGKQIAQWHLDRIEILHKLIKLSQTPEESLGYYKQVVHDLAEAYQTGLYPQGAEVFDKLIKQGGKIASFASYRKILAEFDLEADKPGANLMEVQEATLKKLDQFLVNYPKSDEEPDVLFQLATVNEFNGDEKEAAQYYSKLAQQYADSEPGKKAAGALTRFELDGKPLQLSGKSLGGKTVRVDDFKGKTLLVLFWTSMTDPDRRELNDLTEIYKKYHDKNFDVLAINLDPDQATLDAFLKGNTLPWTVVHEEKGMDGQLANEFGIISTPTMFLIDPQGKVMNRKIRKASEVEKYLEKPLASRPVGLGADVNPK